GKGTARVYHLLSQAIFQREPQITDCVGLGGEAARREYGAIFIVRIRNAPRVLAVAPEHAQHPAILFAPEVALLGPSHLRLEGGSRPQPGGDVIVGGDHGVSSPRALARARAGARQGCSCRGRCPTGADSRSRDERRPCTGRGACCRWPGPLTPAA